MKKKSIRYIIVTDKPKLFEPSEDRLVVTPHDFINRPDSLLALNKKARIINLSGDYEYLSRGYYVSLLSEARTLQSLPGVGGIISLNWKRNYTYALPELNAILEKHFTTPFEEPLTRSYTSFFGRHTDPKIEPVTRKMFDIFRFPVLSFEIKYTSKEKWAITHISTPSFNTLLSEQLKVFQQDLAQFTGSAWRENKPKPNQERYWLAILHNPSEKTPPSNPQALKKFIDVGRKMGIWVELITKEDFASLLEYDALFIRETTAINHHTYRFAQKAESEDLPTIEDTASIIRCCNKIYLNELMDIHKIDKPHSTILDKKSLTQHLNTIKLPTVLKVPDGAFSLGVYKVSTPEELKEKALALLEKSEFILCQEFVPSQYDWRIGVLDNQPLFASKYFMAKGHWQIYNHAAPSAKNKVGADESVALDDVPKPILDAAIKASSLIGDGLYGVDIKQLEDGRVLVIEVNDNPNIDAGVEDKILGDDLYKKILTHIIKKIEA